MFIHESTFVPPSPLYTFRHSCLIVEAVSGFGTWRLKRSNQKQSVVTGFSMRGYKAALLVPSLWVFGMVVIISALVELLWWILGLHGEDKEFGMAVDRRLPWKVHESTLVVGMEKFELPTNR